MTQITIKLPAFKEVEFSVIAEDESIPVRGNAISSGNDKEDKKVEDLIISRRRTNVWAWASVSVQAKWKGIESDIEYLGACSYKNSKDFVENSGYYDDMAQTCYEDLINKIKALAE